MFIGSNHLLNLIHTHRLSQFEEKFQQRVHIISLGHYTFTQTYPGFTRYSNHYCVYIRLRNLPCKIESYKYLIPVEPD